jgi:hypothetical protein
MAARKLAAAVALDARATVRVGFLRDATGAQPGKFVSVDDEGVSALVVSFAGIVHDWYQQKKISGRLLDRGAVSTEVVRFADVQAFVILKALALDPRMANKDAADLIHVLRYAGEIEEIAAFRRTGIIRQTP